MFVLSPKYCDISDGAHDIINLGKMHAEATFDPDILAKHPEGIDIRASMEQFSDITHTKGSVQFEQIKHVDILRNNTLADCYQTIEYNEYFYSPYQVPHKDEKSVTKGVDTNPLSALWSDSFRNFATFVAPNANSKKISKKLSEPGQENPSGREFEDIIQFPFNRRWRRSLPKLITAKVGYIVDSSNGLTFMSNKTVDHNRVLLPGTRVNRIKFDKQHQGSLHVWDLN